MKNSSSRWPLAGAWLCMMLGCGVGCALAADVPAAVVRVETGTLDEASYRVDMPAKWNGVLLVYYHGHSETPVTFDKTKPDRMASGFAAAGYAVAQSGYSASEPTSFAIARSAVLVAAFNHYYPGLLPEPLNIGASVLDNHNMIYAGGPESAAALGELIRFKRSGVTPMSGIVPVAEK